MACHALPYLCNLQSATPPLPTRSEPAADVTIPSPATDGEVPSPRKPIEIRPGDQITMPRSLHSPTTEQPAPDELATRRAALSVSTSSASGRINTSLGKAASLLDQPKPPSSRPSTPACPAPPVFPTKPDASSRSDQDLGFRWVLEPRRGHAALNAGIKSLSAYRSITLCAYPADLFIGGTQHLNAAKLTEAQTHGLDAGLRSLASAEAQGDRKGIECVPVWVEERTAGLHYEGFCKKYVFHTRQGSMGSANIRQADKVSITSISIDIFGQSSITCHCPSIRIR